MVSTVEGVRGALPLLAFAVARLWERRDREKKLLTREAYREIAGVEGALAQHAEATMDRIGPERQGLVREIFRNLVTAQGTRAVIDREELLSAFPDREAAEEVLRQLVDARLLTTYEVEGREGEPSHHRVEVVHESLLKAWPRLVRWQVQDEEGAVLRDQLKQAAHLWEEKGRTADLLWTGTAYREYELWRQRYPGALTALEEDFARSMAEKARRKRRLVRAAVAAALVGATTRGPVPSASCGSRRLRAARLAVASKLVALGRNELERYPAATLAYARKSLETADNAEARRLAVEALWRSPSLRVLPMENGGTLDDRLLSRRDEARRLHLLGHGPRCIPTTVRHRQPSGASEPAAGAARPSHRRETPCSRGGRAIRSAWSRSRTAGRSGGSGLSCPQGRSGIACGLAATSQGILIGSRAGRRAGRHQTTGVSSRTTRATRPGWVRSAALMGPSTTPVTRLALSGTGAFGCVPWPETSGPPNARWLGWRRRSGRAASRSPRRSPAGRGRARPGRLTLWPVDPPSSRPEQVLSRPKPEPIFPPVFDATGTRIAWGSTAERRGLALGSRGPARRGAPRPPAARRRGGHTGRVRPRRSWLAVAHPDSRGLLGDRPAVAAGPGRARRRTAEAPLHVRLATSRLVRRRDGLSVWPLDPGVAPTRARLPARTCYGLSLTPDDRQVLWRAPRARFTSPRSTARVTDRVPSTAASTTHESPRRSIPRGAGAPRSRYTGRSVRKNDPALGSRSPASACASGHKPRMASPTTAIGGWPCDVAFLADGRLIVGQAGGVRLLDPETEPASGSGSCRPRDVAVRRGQRRRPARGRRSRAGSALPESCDGSGEVVFFDLATRRPPKHRVPRESVRLAGPRRDGSVLVTGDLDGAVRVGPSDGREPHLLCCHAGRVDVVAVSPDGKWVASASGGEIRLWPMPDLSKPPPHTLPYEELMAKLRALTNLQVVEDKASATGYKLDIGPFPGWKDVPTW